eukprot:gene17927-12025_t
MSAPREGGWAGGRAGGGAQSTEATFVLTVVVQAFFTIEFVLWC